MLREMMMAALPPQPIAYVTSALGSTLSSGATSVTVPAHQAGDLLIVFGASQTVATSTPAGWTSLAEIGSSNSGGRYGRVVYKYGTGGSEVVSFQSGSGTSSAVYSSVIVLRNVVGIGAVALRNNDANQGESLPLPPLTMQAGSGSSAVLGASFGPWLTAAGDMTIYNGLALLLGAASFTGRSATIDYTAALIGYSIELLGAA